MEISSPKVTIITATFNAAAHLPHTICSLREQTSRDFEWIVVDGNSNDGTQELLRENEDVITHWISEQDRGIYDAFNKGIAMARGEWLIFLGAGDELAAPETIQACSKELEKVSEETKLVYGYQTLISQIGRVPIETLGAPWPDIMNRWDYGRLAMPPHGSTFNRRTLFSELGAYDLRFSIASDAHFFYRAVRKHVPVFIPLEVSRAQVGGVSLSLDTIRTQFLEAAAINRDLGIELPLRIKIIEKGRIVIASILSFMPPKVACHTADFLRRLMGKPPLWSVR